MFLVKASDVPTHVDYGAADIGVVGKDTLLEEGRSFMRFWIWDLGNVICVSASKTTNELLKHQELIRLKPPNIR